MAFQYLVILLLTITGVYIQPVTTRSYCMPNEDCWPSDFSIQEFGEHLKGHLIQPFDAPYVNLTLMKDLYFTKAPGLIVLVKSTSDVRKAIHFATRYHIRITVHSCGHDLNGKSTADGSLQINFMNMDWVDVREHDSDSPTGSSVVTQAGADFQKVYAKTAEYGKQIVGGFCPKVCVSGYTMGGGFGPLARSYGLSVDNVLSFIIVLYNGATFRCSKKQHRSLFWAVRGGGGGTFGVVTAWRFAIHDAPSGGVVGLHIMYPVYVNGSKDVGEDITRHLMETLPELPDAWGGFFLIGVYFGPAVIDGPTINLLMVHNGPRNMSSFSSIDAIVNYRPEVQIFSMFTDYPTFNDYSVTNDLYPRYLEYLENSGFIHWDDLDDKDGLVDFITGPAITPRIPGTMSGCTIIPVGGRVLEHSSASVSSNFRYADLLVVCVVISPIPGLIPRDALRVDNKFLDVGLAPFRHGVYMNEAALDLTRWKKEFWGDKYKTLLKIKKRYDPHNVFYCYHCVGS